jgi:hypothetical protein
MITERLFCVKALEMRNWAFSGAKKTPILMEVVRTGVFGWLKVKAVKPRYAAASRRT